MMRYDESERATLDGEGTKEKRHMKERPGAKRGKEREEERGREKAIEE